MRSRYRRRASPPPSLTAMASTARRAPRGTSPVPPFPLSPGVDSVTADRDPPVRLPYASLAPLPYGAPPPIPCTSRSPSTPTSPTSPTGLPALRRAGGETPSTCTLLRALSRYLEGSFRDAPRVLPRYPGRYPSLYAVQQYVPRRPVRRPPRALPGVRRPYLSKKFSHPLRDGPFSPRYDAPDPSHGRVLLLAQAVPPAPPRLEPSPGPPERSWGTPSASRSPSSPPRRRSTPRSPPPEPRQQH